MTHCLQKLLGKASESPQKASDKNSVWLGTKDASVFSKFVGACPLKPLF